MRQTAYVRIKPDADNLTISLVLAGRQRNLNRPVDEPLEKPFTRIRANLVPPKQDKRNKKKKQDPAAAAEQQQQAPELFVGLFRDAEGTQPIDPSTPNGTAWLQAALLQVGTDCFDVLLNPPTVESLSLQAFPMPGYPLLPTVSIAFADSALCRWRWLRRRRQQPGVPASNGGGGSSKRDAPATAAAAEWEDTGCSSMRYTPSDDDIGCMLRVECTPGAPASAATSDAAAAAAGTAPAAAGAAAVVYGEAVTADTGPVTAGPEQPAARQRQLHPGVPLPEPWRFRVMSYNILADQYAGTGYAQQVLFNYCPTRLLDNNYRRQLVLEEIGRYQPDICCLQEVDDKVFGEFLAPHLALAGFGGHYTNKQGKVREGSAMFWRASKWGCAALQDVLLRDVFRLPLSARHSQFQQMLDSSPALTEALQKVTTIAQMVLLVPRDTAASDGSNGDGGVAAGAAAPVLVINTHLFFHPFAPHIRSLHTAAVLEEAAAALAEWQQQAAEQQQQQGNGAAAAAAVEPGLLGRLAQLPPPTVLFCGDLNSDLNDGVPGVIEMLQTGRLAADHWDWQMGASFSWGKSEEEYEEEQQEPEQSQQQQQQQQQRQQQPMDVQADGADAQPAPAPSAAAGMDVSVPFVLRSADDLATPYTNYTSGYKALLDYVWYDPTRLHVTRQLPVPAEHLLASFIPSPNFPSDHLAVVYDLAFKPAGAAAAAAAQQAAGARQHDRTTFALLPATEDHVADAVAALQRGQVCALPTDTLYGLAAAAGSAQAVQQMRQIKARAPDTPFAVAVADVGEIGRFCCTEQLPPGLLHALLPGPVTVLLPLRPGADLAPGVLPAATPSQPVLLGVRVVASEFVRGVCGHLGGGIALTSANPSGGESRVCVADFRELWQFCGAVFDGGRVPISSNDGSTVLDLSEVTAAAAAAGGDGGDAANTQQPSGGGFRIVRPGVAAESVVELLTKAFGLQQLL